MPHFAPFVAYFRVVPDRGDGKRNDYIQSASKLASLVYDELETTSGINIATPGGGQRWGLRQFSNHVNGTQWVPQIGNSPSQLRIAGFYEVATDNAQVAANKMVFETNEVKSGLSGQYPWSPDGLPTSAVESEVDALKTLLEAAALNATNIVIKLWKLDYKGVIWGATGHHFP